MTSNQARRKEERIAASLPVSLGRMVGVTRNISASGIFFEVGNDFPLGGEISFSVVLDTPYGKVVLQSKGNVVRTEQCSGKTGVAVQIIESVMAAVD